MQDFLAPVGARAACAWLVRAVLEAEKLGSFRLL